MTDLAVEQRSLRERIAALSPDERREYVEALDEIELDLLAEEDWSVVGRPSQFLPGPIGSYLIWDILAGRGWGKTRTGAEGTKERLRELSPLVDQGRAGDGVRWFLSSPRQSEVLHTQLEGESGLQRIIPPSWLIAGSWERSINRSTLILKLMVDGTYPAQLEGYSARVLDSPRGHQWHGGWADEPGTYPDAHFGLDGNEQGESFMGNVLLGLRLRPAGGLIVTGTPKNNRLTRQLRDMKGTIVTTGRTAENLHNLAPLFKETIVARYQGTRLGRQELDAEILEGVGMLFQRGWFRDLAPGAWPWPHNTPTRTIRYWDLASGEETDNNPDPDWTVGTRIVMDPDRRLYVIDHVRRFRRTPGAREQIIAETARSDGLPFQVIETEPGNAGTTQLFTIGRELDGVGVRAKKWPERGSISGKKEARAEIVAGAAEQGRVWLRDGDWKLDVLDELEEFPIGSHDDIVDTLSGAFAFLRGGDTAALLHSNAGAPALAKPASRTLNGGHGGNGYISSLPRPGARTNRNY